MLHRILEIRRSIHRTSAVTIAFVIAWALASCSSRDGAIEGTGTVEVDELDVAPLLAARVVRVHVEEGARVAVGDTLVTLTQATTLPEVQARRAALAGAEATLRDLEAGPRSAEIREAAAQVRAAEAEAVNAEREYERARSLFNSGSISAQQLEAARTAASVAAERRNALRQQRSLVTAGARPERIRAARAEVEGARASLLAAQRTAAELVLTAPESGVVLTRNAEPGEVLASGTPAITIGRSGSPWVRIYLGQGATARIRVGDSATARLDDYPDRPIPGRVLAINTSAEFTPRVALTERERADLLFGVKVALSDTTGFLKPGLPVTVRIHPSRATTAR